MSQDDDVTVAELERILLEADAMIRQRLKALGIEVPHIVMAVSPEILAAGPGLALPRLALEAPGRELAVRA